MKKFFAKILCAGVFLALLSPVAKADAISGAISIAGLDTFDSTSITFNPTTASILASTIAGVNAGGTATLTSFTFAPTLNPSPVVLFSTLQNGITTSFTISALTLVSVDTVNDILNLKGNGVFSQTGNDNTLGQFSLTSSKTGLTSFQLVGNTAATPEPSSLMLLGTGLISTAGMLVRRRRAASIA